MAANATLKADGGLVPLSGAGQSCFNWGLDAGGRIYAYCFRQDGTYRTSEVELSLCVANDDGALHCRSK